MLVNIRYLMLGTVRQARQISLEVPISFRDVKSTHTVRFNICIFHIYGLRYIPPPQATQLLMGTAQDWLGRAVDWKTYRHS